MKILVVFCWIIACTTKTVLHVNKPTFLYVNSNKVKTSNSLSRWNTNMVQTSYFFQVDYVYKKQKFHVSASIFFLRCDRKQKLLSHVFAPCLVTKVFTMCALLVINLDMFIFLIDEYELGQKVNT